MKILHTADWHLGKRLEQFSRLEEQKEVLDELCALAEAEQVDAVLVAGDLFDTFNPSAEAQELLYRTLHRLADDGRRAVVAIAGNHDSPDRINAPDALAKASGILLVGYPNAPITPFETRQGVRVTRADHGFVELQLPKSTTPLRLLLTPFANELRLKTFLGVEQSEESLRQLLQSHWQDLADRYCDEQGVNVLVTHLYVMDQHDPTPPEEPDDERPILHIGGAQAIYTQNVPPQLQYVALGHLHRYQVVSEQPCPVVYSSSPLAYSFSEAHQTKYVVVIEAKAGQPIQLRPIALTRGKKLRRGTFSDITSAIAWLQTYPNDLMELTLESDSYLEVVDKKRLMEAHDGLVQIIPRVRGLDQTTTAAQIDLQMSMEALFVSYFKSKNNTQEPSEGLMAVFKEVLGVADEESQGD